MLENWVNNALDIIDELHQIVRVYCSKKKMKENKYEEDAQS